MRAKAAYDASPGARSTRSEVSLSSRSWASSDSSPAQHSWFLFLTNEQLGLTSQLAYTVVVGILVFAAAWYLIAKYPSSGVAGDRRIGYAFKEIPPE